jgi:prophage regulatory protein
MMNAIPKTGFLRLPQVLEIIPVGRSTFWAGVKSGRFPKPIKLGPRTTAWRAEDITLFVEQVGKSEMADQHQRSEQ